MTALLLCLAFFLPVGSIVRTANVSISGLTAERRAAGVSES